jgi:hypothetical protein
MDCAECARLKTEHERLRRVYVKAVDLFFATGYRATDAEHNMLKNSLEEARSQWEVARFELDKHKRSVHSGVPENRQVRAQSEGAVKRWAFW